MGRDQIMSRNWLMSWTWKGRDLTKLGGGRRCRISTLNPTRSLSRNAGLLVSYMNYLIPPQTTSATNLKLHTKLSSNPDTPLVSTSVNPPNSNLAPVALNSFDSVSCILLLRKATVSWLKEYIFFLFHLYMC